MGVGIALEPCGFCKGSGGAQRLEERREDGWHANTMLAHWIADAWIKADKWAPIRWIDCDCPSCYGAGSVTVEYVRCKVF